MLNYADVQTLREKGMSNLDILKSMGRVVPSAQRAYDSLVNNKNVPEWQRESLVGKMLDKKVPKTGPSGLGLMAVSGMNEAQKAYDMKTAAIQNTTGFMQQTQADVQALKQNPSQMSLLGQIGSTLAPAGATREGPNLFQRIGTDIQNRGQELGQAMEGADMSTIGGRARLFGESFKAFTGGIADVGGEILQTASGILPKFIEDGIGLMAQDLKAPEVAEKMTQDYAQWSQQHPDAALALEGIGNLARATLNTYGVQQTALQSVKGVKNAAQGTKAFMDSPPPDVSVPPANPKTVQQLVQPQTTKKLIQDVGAKNPELIEEGMFTNKLKPDQYQQGLAKTAQENIPGFGQSKNPVKNAKLTQKTIETKSQDLLKALKSRDAALPRQELGATVKQRVADVAADFGDQPGVFDSTVRIWETISAKHPGTLSGQWKARIEFYKTVESRFGSSIYDKANARAQAVKAVGQAANEGIEAAAKRAGLSFQKEIDLLSELFDIKESLSTKFSPKGPLKKALDSPIGKTAAVGAAGATGYQVYQSVGN